MHVPEGRVRVDRHVLRHRASRATSRIMPRMETAAATPPGQRRSAAVCRFRKWPRSATPESSALATRPHISRASPSPRRRCRNCPTRSGRRRRRRAYRSASAASPHRSSPTSVLRLGFQASLTASASPSAFSSSRATSWRLSTLVQIEWPSSLSTSSAPGLDRGFEHGVLVARAVRIFDQAHAVEAVAHRTRGAEVAVKLAWAPAWAEVGEVSRRCAQALISRQMMTTTSGVVER